MKGPWSEGRGRMDEIASRALAGLRGAFKRFLRHRHTHARREGESPQGRIRLGTTVNHRGFPSGMKGDGKSSGRRADASKNTSVSLCLGARIARYA